MRALIFSFTILLTLAICSCRSSRQSSVAYYETDTLAVESVTNTSSSDDLISVIIASGELELSDVTVDFFQPVIDGVAWLGQDSVLPASRAAPSRLRIGSVKAKESTRQLNHNIVDTDVKETVNLSSVSSVAEQKESVADAEIARSLDWLIYTIVAIAAVAVFVAIVITIRLSRRF